MRTTLNIDAHLLAATALEGTAQIWTHDKRLARIATGLKLAPGTI